MNILNKTHIQTEAVSFSGTSQNKYKGMIKVLPTISTQISPRPTIPNGLTAVASGIGSVNRSGIFPDHHPFERVQNAGAISSKQDCVPRLPPPPKTLKVNNSQRNERLGGQNRADLCMSVQDLSQLGNGSRTSLEMSPSSLFRSFNSSATDLQEVGNSIKPQQPAIKVLPVNQTNNQHHARNPLSSNAALSPQTEIHNTRKQTNNGEMSGLQDELAKLKLELAAMKDPMEEHEEWLKNQSVQVKELEELQKQLQSNMVVNKKQTEMKEELTNKVFNALPTSPKPVVNKTNMDIQPTTTALMSMSKSKATTEIRSPILSTKPTKEIRPPILSPKPTNEFRPPILSPKPKNPKGKLLPFNFPDTSPASPKSEMTGEYAGESKKNSDKSKEELSNNTRSNVRSVEKVENNSASPSDKVKRISQLFETNASSAEEKSVQRSNLLYDAKSKNGTIRKLDPSLLRTIQASEEAKMSSIPIPSKVIFKKNDAQKSSVTHPEKPIPMPTKPVTSQAPQSPQSMNRVVVPNVSRVASFSTHKRFQSVLPPYSKPTTIQQDSNPSSTHTVLPTSAPSSSSKHKEVSPPVPPPNPKPAVHLPQVTHTPASAGHSPPVPSPSPKPSVLQPPVPLASSKPVHLSLPQVSHHSPEATRPQNVPPQFPKPIEQIRPALSPSPSTFYVVDINSVPSTTQSAHSLSTLEPKPINSVPKHEIVSPKEFPSHQYHRYEYIELETQSPSTTKESKNESSFPKSLAKQSHSSHRYANVPDDEFQNTPEQPPLLLGPPRHSAKDHHSNSSNLLSMSNLSSSSTQHLAVPSKQSVSHVLRPTTPPPPPPNRNSAADQKEQSPTPPSSQVARIPVAPPPPQSELISTPPHVPISDGLPPLLRACDSGEISPSSTQSGSPVPSSKTASKLDLMEQIRQFKQSGKSLKRASLESGASNGTPTRVRKNFMQDALQTRFQAFCGNETESSEEEDPIGDDYDWDE